MKSQSNFYNHKQQNIPTLTDNSHRDKSNQKQKLSHLKTTPITLNNFYTPKFEYDSYYKNAHPSSPKHSTFTKQNQELKGLKIAYNKLKADNINNKIMIETMLGIEPSEKITKKEMKNLLENSVFNEDDTLKLQETHKIMKLKLLCKDFKQQLEIKETQIEELKQKEIRSL